MSSEKGHSTIVLTHHHTVPKAPSTVRRTMCWFSIHQQPQRGRSHQTHFIVTDISQPSYASSELWNRCIRNKSCHLLSAFPSQAISFAHGLPNHLQIVLQNLVVTVPSATDLLVASEHPSTLGTCSHTPLVSQVHSEGGLNTKQVPTGEALSIDPHGAERWEK